MAIAITIKPQHLFNILNGTKLGEIRKNKALINAIKKEIAEKGKATIYAICSKAKNKHDYLCFDAFNGFYELKEKWNTTPIILNGKVVCKFECKKVEKLFIQWGTGWTTESGKLINQIEKESCVGRFDLYKYLGGKCGYLIHISNLTIFDKPKELKELYKIGAWKVYEEQFDSSYLKRTEQEIMEELGQTITKAPQNFCYVEDTL